MIMLKKRTEIIQARHIIASELTKIQRLCFDEDVLQYYKDRNEEQLYWEEFDCINNKTIEYDSFDKEIIMNQDGTRPQPKELLKALVQIFNIIDAKKIIMLAYVKRDFFGNRSHKFKPVINAYMNLEKITGSKSYKEAFLFDSEDLVDIMDILFWVTSYDASFPEFVFLFDQKEQMRIHLSYVQNIYLREFKKERITDEVIAALELGIVLRRTDNR